MGIFKKKSSNTSNNKNVESSPDQAARKHRKSLDSQYFFKHTTTKSDTTEYSIPPLPSIDPAHSPVRNKYIAPSSLASFRNRHSGSDFFNFPSPIMSNTSNSNNGSPYEKPTILLKPPLLHQTPASEDPKDYSFDGFDDVGVAASRGASYSPSIISSVNESQTNTMDETLKQKEPSSIEDFYEVAKDPSEIPPVAPSHGTSSKSKAPPLSISTNISSQIKPSLKSPSAAAMASSSSRNIKIGTVRMIASSHSQSPTSAMPLGIEAMHGEEGFGSVDSSAHTSMYNSDDEQNQSLNSDISDGYPVAPPHRATFREISPAAHHEMTAALNDKSSSAYKTVSNDFSESSITPTTSLKAQSTNSDSSYVNVTNSNSPSASSSYQNISIGSNNNSTSNIENRDLNSSHAYREVLGDEESVELPYNNGNDDNNNRNSSADSSFDNENIYEQNYSHEELKKYRPKASHGAFIPPRDLDDDSIYQNETELSNSSSQDYIYNSNDMLSSKRYDNYRDSIISTASSAILDSSGGIQNIDNSMASLNISDDGNGYDLRPTTSVSTIKETPINSAMQNSAETDATSALNESSKSINEGREDVIRMGHIAPLIDNEGKGPMTRTSQMLLKRETSSSELSVHTVNVKDNFKNEHIPAPVILDEVTGEPMVFYPAPIPVELKLPPLLSKKNQLKAISAAKKNRPKTFIVPPPPVWHVDPTILPENRDSMLLRRKSTDRLSNFPTTVKLQRRRSSAGTLDAFSQYMDEANKKDNKLNDNVASNLDNTETFKELSSEELSFENKDSRNLTHKERNSDASSNLVGNEDDAENDKVDELKPKAILKTNRISTMSKLSYIEGEPDDWDDGRNSGFFDKEAEEEEDDDNIDTGHYLNDEVLSDCATVPSDEEYQEEILIDDEETEKNKTEEERMAEKLGVIDRNGDDFAFTSFDPNAAITERGLLGGSLSYSSGILPAVGIHPRSLIEELEIRKLEKKARIQKVYYDTTNGYAIAADMYGKDVPDEEQLKRLPTSGHPLDNRHAKTLLELQEQAQMEYTDELNFRKTIHNAVEIERQVVRYGGVKGSKAMLSQMGVLNMVELPSEDEAANPDETLKERRARLKKKKKEQLEAMKNASINYIGNDGEIEDEDEPPNETLAERRARIKKKKQQKKNKQLAQNGLMETESLFENDHMNSSASIDNMDNKSDSISAMQSHQPPITSAY